MQGEFESWKFLAGLGIFLFAMFFVEESLKNLAGRSLKNILRQFTNTPLKGVSVGVFITAILQSSSVVSLMVLAFVGAGIIQLKNAIAIIFGTNLGTTFTGWIVVWIGFGIDIESFALPLIAIGGIGLILFSKFEKIHESGRFLMGFGLLFLGLEYMKLSIGTLAETYDLSAFDGLSPFVFFPVGLIMTAIIQSSSAAMVITLSAFGSGIIPLEAAAVMVVGSDLGTTITTIFGAIKGSAVKKRVALSHVLVNVFSAILALVLLYPLLYLIFDLIQIEDQLLGIVLFHSLFNLIGILLILPFTKPFAAFLETRFKKGNEQISIYLKKTTKGVPEATIENLHKELSHLIEKAFQLNLNVFHHNPKNFSFSYPAKTSEHGFFSIDEYPDNYAKIKQLEGEIVEFYLIIYGEKLEPEVAEDLNSCVQSVRNAMSSVKQLKDILHNIHELENSSNTAKHDAYLILKNELKTFYLDLYRVFKSENKASSFEQLLDLIRFNNRVYAQFLKQIYKYIDEHELSEFEISTVLTVNREIHHSNKHLILAIKDCILTKGEAESFNTIPELN
jgi:phosphate:Na+ symporter